MKKAIVNNSISIILISLLFVSCNKNDPGPSKILSGSTWVVTRIDYPATNTSQILSDTVYFVGKKEYTFNQVSNSYRIGNYNSEPNYYFLWEGCVIFGDDVEAWLNPDIIDQGVLNGIEFNKLADDNSIYVWMHKI